MMKRYAVAATLALLLDGMAHAAVIELTPAHASSIASQPLSHLATTGHNLIVTPPSGMSELPEPEVFAMMLVGLVLVGYRASRHTSDKFN